MKHEEDLPEVTPEPDIELVKQIGQAAMSFGIAERDTFLDGLSLGVWDEEFDYYRPSDEK